MSLLDDYLAKAEADLVVALDLVAGAENSLDIAAGESTLTQDAIAEQTKAFAALKAWRDWLKAVIAHLKVGVEGKYDEVPVFDVPQSVKDEMALKHKQMLDFSKILRPIIIGATSGEITVKD